MGLALRDPHYKLGVETDHLQLVGGASAVTQGEKESLANFKPLSKVRAHRKVRPEKLTMTQAKYGRGARGQGGAALAEPRDVQREAVGGHAGRSRSR